MHVHEQTISLIGIYCFTVTFSDWQRRQLGQHQSHSDTKSGCIAFENSCDTQVPYKLKHAAKTNASSHSFSCTFLFQFELTASDRVGADPLALLHLLACVFTVRI